MGASWGAGFFANLRSVNPPIHEDFTGGPGGDGCNPAMHDPDDLASNRSQAASLECHIATRYSRRDILRLAGGLIAATAVPAALPAWSEGERVVRPQAGFALVGWSQADTVEVPAGYRFQTLAPWGDPITADAPAFDPAVQTGSAQSVQMGYNHDFVGYLPDDDQGGVLCVSRRVHDRWDDVPRLEWAGDRRATAGADGRAWLDGGGSPTGCRRPVVGGSI